MKQGLALLLLLTGCTSMTREGTLIRHASFVEKCPEEQIQILRMDHSHINVEADVCGRVHRYLDIATHDGVDLDPRWQDVTPAPATPCPAVVK